MSAQETFDSIDNVIAPGSVDPIDRFKEYLAKRSLRMTRERRILVEEIFNGQHHFTVSDLCERLVAAGLRGASRSTVYRAIPHLLDAGLIFEVSLKSGNEEQVYENTLVPRHHDHLTCEKCGEVIEFDNEAIHEMREHVARKYGYMLRRHVLHLRGICARCQEGLSPEEMES
ncbi:transcriptional repressor [bacterium]|nr:transcriptional repressor [bacterium]